jgi:hypothetical protein
MRCEGMSCPAPQQLGVVVQRITRLLWKVVIQSEVEVEVVESVEGDWRSGMSLDAF